MRIPKIGETWWVRLGGLIPYSKKTILGSDGSVHPLSSEYVVRIKNGMAFALSIAEIYVPNTEMFRRLYPCATINGKFIVVEKLPRGQRC